MSTLNVRREKSEASQDLQRQYSIADYRRRTATGYQFTCAVSQLN
jgi:hypothetical protein